MDPTVAEIIEVLDPSYKEAVDVACTLRSFCWFMLGELSRAGHPQPATQAYLQRLEAANPWVTREDNTPLEERLTEAEWRMRNADSLKNT